MATRCLCDVGRGRILVVGGDRTAVDRAPCFGFDDSGNPGFEEIGRLPQPPQRALTQV